MTGWTLRHHGDSALALELGLVIDPLVNARALAIGERVRRAEHPGVRDVVEGYSSVTVTYDPLRTDVRRLSALFVSAAEQERGAEGSGREVMLPVCYGGTYGPDLGEVANRAGGTEDEVVAIHSEATYRVYMLGFLPGFAYLGSVSDRIVSPRRVTPRLRVPAGSVGIAGRQTGVYPLEAPGGWQLVGRCPVKVFDPGRADPFLLRAGDSVRFEAVSEKEYTRMAGGTVS
jgi:KipI family sensor histidine kinase inhibitor